MDAAVVVLDGWGLAPPDQAGRDAVDGADTPNFDGYRATGGFGRLATHGRTVGLPAGQMGNSEVGHLTIGAGRPVEQPYTRIEDARRTDKLADVDAVSGAFEHAAEHGGRVHLLGLVSDGGVHADHRHLHALIGEAAERGLPATTHAITDGRDTSPTAGAEFVAELAGVAAAAGTGAVASVSGRYYAMDRDHNWERTHRAYDAIVAREADHVADSAELAVERSYGRGDTDEFVDPTLIEGRPGVAAGDAVLFTNFRGDRARQLTRMLADIDPEWGFRTDPPDARVVTMTEYDRGFDLPVAFPPVEPQDTLGEVVADSGATQLRVAESEKYAHVTYFLNGGREVEFGGERREIIDSPAVGTYDECPVMSAGGVTDTTIEAVEREDPDALVLNYANPDMVGHTGDFAATVAAVEAVDAQLGRLIPALRRAGADVLVTADHGNADDMGTAEQPHTAHTFNPAPVLYLPPEGAADRAVRDEGELADVAPTVLELMEVELPEAMTGESLLV